MNIGKQALKAKIDQHIYENDAQAITGEIMNIILQDMVDTLLPDGLDAGQVLVFDGDEWTVVDSTELNVGQLEGFYASDFMLALTADFIQATQPEGRLGLSWIDTYNDRYMDYVAYGGGQWIENTHKSAVIEMAHVFAFNRTTQAWLTKVDGIWSVLSGGGDVKAISVNGVRINPDSTGLITLPDYYTKTESDARYSQYKFGDFFAKKAAGNTQGLELIPDDLTILFVDSDGNDRARIYFSDPNNDGGYFMFGLSNGTTERTFGIYYNENILCYNDYEIWHEGNFDPSDYATQSWVEAKGYITNAALTGYATQSWVSNNYLPLTGGTLTGDLTLNSDSTIYAVGNDIIQKHSVGQILGISDGPPSGIDFGYGTRELYALKLWGTNLYFNTKRVLTTDDLAGYATQAWVEAKGYITAAALTGYATQSWVEAKGYITAAALTGYATEDWVDENYSYRIAGLEADYIQPSEPTGDLVTGMSWIEYDAGDPTAENKYYVYVSNIPHTPAQWIEQPGLSEELSHPFTIVRNSSTGEFMWRGLSGEWQRISSPLTTVVSVGGARPNWQGDIHVDGEFEDDFGPYHNMYRLKLFDEYIELPFVNLSSTHTANDWGLWSKADVVALTDALNSISAAIPTAVSQLTNDSGYITASALTGYATQSWVSNNYLPLTGGTLTGDLTLNSDSTIYAVGNDIIQKHSVGQILGISDGPPSGIDFGYGTRELYALKLWGTNLYFNTKRVLTTDDLTGYATQSWVEAKGYLTAASFDNYYNKAQSDARFSVVDGLTAPPATSREGKPGDFVCVKQNNAYSLYACFGQVYTTSWIWNQVALTSDIPSVSGFLTKATADTLYAPISHTHSQYQLASTAINTSNIGSQSVAYASSAGNADTLDGNHASAFASASHSHSYLPLSGGAITGAITYNNGGSWISARDHCAVKTTRTSGEGSDWHPVVGLKTSAGFWSFGSVGGENLAFSHDTDADYTAGRNTSTVINMPLKGGTIALTSDIPDVSGYLPKSGGTLTGNLTLGTHDLIFSGSDQGDIIWYDGSGAEKHRLWGGGADGSLYYRYYSGAQKLIWHQGNLTNNNQLSNGAGYITSSGSCAYATSAGYASSAGNADTLDGYHESAFMRKKADYRFYNFIGQSHDSAWYKVTFPASGNYVGSTQWHMIAFEVSFGGPYAGGPSGRLYVAYYFSQAAYGGAYSKNNVYATCIGTEVNASSVQIKYNAANPMIVYIKCAITQYSSMCIQNLTVSDNGASYDFSTTTIETTSEPSCDSSVPIDYVDHGSISGYATGISSQLPQISTSLENDAVQFIRQEDEAWGYWGVGNGYKLEKALRFQWYSTYNYFGLIRGGSTNSAGFGFGYQATASSAFIPTAQLDIDGSLYLRGNAYCGNNLVYHSGNCNNTSTPWSASTLSTSGNIYTANTSHIIQTGNYNNNDSDLSNITNLRNYADRVVHYNSDSYGYAEALSGRSGNYYMQAGEWNGSAYYGILLNPFGGNVGIGTTTPSYKLHVNGSFNATSGYINGNTIYHSGNLTAATLGAMTQSAADARYWRPEVDRLASGKLSLQGGLVMLSDITCAGQCSIGTSSDYFRYIHGNIFSVHGRIEKGGHYFRRYLGVYYGTDLPGSSVAEVGDYAVAQVYTDTFVFAVYATAGGRTGWWSTGQLYAL